MTTAVTWSRLAVVVLALTLADAHPGAAGPVRSPYPVRALPSHPGRIVVKYRPEVTASVDSFLAQGVPLATLTGSDSLDKLHHQLGVRAARLLFTVPHDTASDRRGAYLNTLAAVREKFPARSARSVGKTLPDLSNIYVLDLPSAADVERAAALYSADPAVEYAHPDYVVHTTVTPNDYYFGRSGDWGQSYQDLWGLFATQAPSAWDAANGTDVVVAVVDTGVDYNHPDIAANMWQNPGEIPGNGIDDDGNGYVDDVRGWDFVDNDNDPNDLMGHGTHVAGIVAAVGNNGIGVIGMGFGARVMAIRALDANGYGYYSDLASAILYAAQNGADIINASWGGFGLPGPSVLRDAVDTAVSLGVVVLAAAGNSSASVDSFVPASYPNVIAVGATGPPAPTETRAYFSNYGNALSVAAPGVDVLSLRSATNKFDPKEYPIVGSQYLRLSGTSMASPHAAGLTAVLLSAQPTLRPEEVRWHLELNADQLGYSGYDGQAWNPYLGWGRINAQNVFNTTPVTTRLRGTADLHLFAGSVFADAVSASLSFTTLDSVPWTLSAPSWLVGAPSSGSGPATLAFSADATGLDVGSYTGTVAVSAPTAVDGGASFDASIVTHQDTRIGAPVEVSSDNFSAAVTPPPVPAVSDGVGELILRMAGYLPWRLGTQRLDAAGNVTGPTIIDTNGRYDELGLAFDGRNYLATWVDYKNDLIHVNPDVWRYSYTLKARRIGPTGEALDYVPLVLAHCSSLNNLVGIGYVDTAFDGTAYVVDWVKLKVSYKNPATAKVFVQRIGIDGTLRGKPRLIYPTKTTLLIPKPWVVFPHIKCGSGNCLFIWEVRTGTTTPEGLYLDQAYGVLLRDGRLASAAFQILDGINIGAAMPSLGTNGTDFIVAGNQLVSCPESIICGINLVAKRVSGTGAVLDSSNIQINNGLLERYPGPPTIIFDGNNYIFGFYGGGSNGAQAYAAEVSPTGQVLDTESPALLLLQQGVGQVPPEYGSSFGFTLAPGPTQSMFTWVDTLNFLTMQQTNPIFVQRVLAHSPPATYPVLAIGSIGPQSVAERAALSFILSAPGLDAQGTTFSATNLPAGAVLDPTGIFRWMPEADQAGGNPVIHFAATDGVQTPSEDVAITVTEANLSAGGTVTSSTGTALPAIAVRLSGGGIETRTALTDSAGRFRFDDLVPGTYSLRLAPPSTHAYTATPSTTRVTVADSDVTGVQLVLTQK